MGHLATRPEMDCAAHRSGIGISPSTKDTKARFLGEQGNIQFRWEVFNLLNHANFSRPNATVWNGAALTNPCGGQIGATTPSAVSVVSGGVATGATTTINQTFPAFAQAANITTIANRSRQIEFA